MQGAPPRMLVSVPLKILEVGSSWDDDSPYMEKHVPNLRCFLKIGQKSSIYRWIFHEINDPAIKGTPFKDH